MPGRWNLALWVALLTAVGCGKGRGGPAGDSCEAVGEHYLVVARAEVASAEGEDKKNAEAMLSLLPKLKTQLVTECNRDKWSAEGRKCMLAATSASAARECASLLGKPAADPPAAETDPPPGPTPPAGDPAAPSQPEPADPGAM